MIRARSPGDPGKRNTPSAACNLQTASDRDTSEFAFFELKRRNPQNTHPLPIDQWSSAVEFPQKYLSTLISLLNLGKCPGNRENRGNRIISAARVPACCNIATSQNAFDSNFP